ncbi:MAG TPA: hypothetical protein VHZ51_23940, partial [Ktedonobacteraceae bacterium]|nr:hypothetical protein [Ktedonobacteraceae bacterium]
DHLNRLIVQRQTSLGGFLQRSASWLFQMAHASVFVECHAFIPGLVGGLAFVLIFGLLDALGTMPEHGGIQVTEALSWSWKNFQRVQLPSLIVVLLAAVGFGLGKGLVDGFLIGSVFALGFILIGGVSGVQIDEHTHIHPNQGIRTSGWNMLRFGLISSFIIGLVVLPILGLIQGLNIALNISLGI